MSTTLVLSEALMPQGVYGINQEENIWTDLLYVKLSGMGINHLFLQCLKTEEICIKAINAFIT